MFLKQQKLTCSTSLALPKTRCRKNISSGKVRVSAEGGANSKENEDSIKKRLEMAKAYKEKLKEQASSASEQQKVSVELTAVEGVRSQSIPTEQEHDSPYVFKAMEEYASDLAKADTEVFLHATKEAKEYAQRNEPSFRTGGGSAEQAATWLQTFRSQGEVNRIDSSLQAEDFTMEKLRIQKDQGAVIERAKGKIEGTNRKVVPMDDYGIAQQIQEAEISISKEREMMNAALEKEKEGEDLHKPKVATWGVFPRPKNISDTYGGGRNIRPGQVLESEEEAAIRQQRVSDALEKYRKTVGLEVDKDVEQAATSLYEEGLKLFADAKIQDALDKFSTAAATVPIKSKIGGLVYLEKAVCLDSLGRNEEAYKIYKQLKGHTAPGVSKKAQRMLFGFRAAKKLKVDKMDYSAGGVEAWRGYFNKATEGAWGAYSQSSTESEDDKQAELSATAFATAVVLVPLAFVSVLIVGAK